MPPGSKLSDSSGVIHVLVALLILRIINPTCITRSGHWKPDIFSPLYVDELGSDLATCPAVIAKRFNLKPGFGGLVPTGETKTREKVMLLDGEVMPEHGRQVCPDHKCTLLVRGTSSHRTFVWSQMRDDTTGIRS